MSSLKELLREVEGVEEVKVVDEEIKAVAEVNSMDSQVLIVYNPID